MNSPPSARGKHVNMNAQMEYPNATIMPRITCNETPEDMVREQLARSNFGKHDDIGMAPDANRRGCCRRIGR